MKSVYLITMWSGGKPAKKWTSNDKPELLEQGTGVSFVSRETKLPVRIIGSISVEEYESGKEEIERGYPHIDFGEDRPPRKRPRPDITGEPFNPEV
jgi:hypothetical protein